jgi:hypothetical protein
MPWNGSGGFNRDEDFTADLALGPPASIVSAQKVDDEFDNFKDGLQNCLTRDGQNSPSANISWASNKITSLGAPTAGGDATNKTYVDAGSYLGTLVNGLTTATPATSDLLGFADVSDSNNPKKATAQAVVDAVVATVPDNTIPTDKLAFTASDRLLGRSTAGAGAGEEITCTAFARTVLDDADAAAARTTLGVVAASDTAAGLVELATTAETQTGTDAARTITPAGLYSALGVSYMATSTGNAITNGALITFAHGLGRAPRLVQFHVVCVANDATSGYVAGDVIYYDPADGNNTSSKYQAYFDATNVNVRCGGSFFGNFQRKSDGIQVGVSSAANFTLTIRAWA